MPVPGRDARPVPQIRDSTYEPNLKRGGRNKPAMTDTWTS
jgi:hypothetical protein